MQTERSKQLEYNLSVLKRRDAAISRVLDMAGHVVMYRFNEEKQCWDRKNVEGSLFVVERTSAPTHQFVVLNRRSSENLVESINEDFQMELTEQFLLYRNSAQEINGIWFYSPAERSAMSELLMSLSPAVESSEAPLPSESVESAAEAEREPPETGANGTSSNVAQFFSMVQGKLDAPPMPPMPDRSSVSAPIAVMDRSSLSSHAVEGKSDQPALKQDISAPASTAGKPPDVEALKDHLRTQLQGLLQDDAFMNVLTLEYLRQRKAAASSSSQKCRATPAQSPATSAPVAPTPTQLPAHLLSMLTQQGQ